MMPEHCQKCPGIAFIDGRYQACPGCSHDPILKELVGVLLDVRMVVASFGTPEQLARLRDAIAKSGIKTIPRKKTNGKRVSL